MSDERATLRPLPSDARPASDDLDEGAERSMTWERHPADMARLLFSLAAFVVAMALMAADPAGATSLGSSLLQVIGLLPNVITSAAMGTAQILSVVAPSALLVVLILRRRIRLTTLVIAAGALAGGATLGLRHWLDITTPTIPAGRTTARSWVTGALFPSAPYLAGAAAIITVMVPMLPRRWQRSAWLTLSAIAALRVATTVAVPTHIVTAMLLGITIGSALLVATGAPRRRLRAADIRGALLAAGHEAGPLSFDGVDRYSGTLADGEPIALRVVDRDDRDVDLLYGLITKAQRRGIENERFTWSPTERVDHEALVSLLAAQAGAPVQRMLGVARTPDEAGIVILAGDNATPFTELAAEKVTDDILDRLWAGVRVLDEARIGHGQLHLGKVLLHQSEDGDEQVLISDFSRAALSADDERRAIDVAELLVSSALVVGPARAVGAARRTFPDGLGGALPLLQPLALTPTTRQAVRAAKPTSPDLLKELRLEVQIAASVDQVEMAELQRISLARAVSLVGTIVLAYIALMFVSNWAAIGSALGDANWTFLPVIVTMAALTYPTGALSMMGAVTRSLPFVQTTQIMLAQAFLNRFTPANIGGMALRTRYLQSHGIDLPVAASSIGLTSLASGMAQVLMIVGFFLWSGSGGVLGISLPDISTIAVIMLALLVLGGLVWLTPLRSRLLDNKLAVSAVEVWKTIKELMHRPSKLGLLFGGATLGKIVTIIAFSQSCRALGIDLPFAQIGALYLGANTVAAAAPTPGGVGAMEAALVAVLTGAGIEPATSLSAVLIFRLATFWLPVPFSWLALRHVRSTEIA